MSRISNNFFVDRTVKSDGAHCRAFAAEFLTAITLLGFFVDAVLEEMCASYPALRPYIDCFNLLRMLVAIFQRGNPGDIPLCREIMVNHHILFRRLYPNSVKRKMHNQAHLLDFWEVWQVLFSCFGPERHHRLMKSVMNHSYNHPERTVLAHDVHTWVKNLKKECVYQPVHLVGNTNRSNYVFDWPGEGPITFFEWGAGLNTEKGMLHKGDCIQWDSGGGTEVAFALGFGRTTSVRFNYLAFVYVCESVSSVAWRRSTSMRMVAVDSIVCSVPYVSHGANIWPLFNIQA